VIYARPVYGTDYNSPILDLVDNNMQFNFLENTQIEFTPDRHLKQPLLRAGLLRLLHPGVDADTFSPTGGSHSSTPWRSKW
jgi:hypothetical protein